MKTAEFGFGTGDFFFGPEFGSRAITASTGREDAIRRAKALLADGLHYARSRGLKVCVGFKVSGDPTSAEDQERLRARLEALVRAYPMLDYVWLWQSEGLGGGSDPRRERVAIGPDGRAVYARVPISGQPPPHTRGRAHHALRPAGPRHAQAAGAATCRW